MQHKILWLTIELVAYKHGLTCSGLAKTSGLDPTTFNKSKQFTSSGAPRWPSCYTIAKVLNALNITVADFAYLYSVAEQTYVRKTDKQRPSSSVSA